LFAPKGAEFEANVEALAAEVKGAGETPAVRKPDAALGAEADCAGPSMGTIEASGLAV
jgi:hypothetical protein